jgi:hypothetical protein
LLLELKPELQLELLLELQPQPELQQGLLAEL